MLLIRSEGEESLIFSFPLSLSGENVVFSILLPFVGAFCRDENDGNPHCSPSSILHKLATVLEGKMTRGYWETVCLIN